MMMQPVALLLRRLSRVLSYHRFTLDALELGSTRPASVRRRSRQIGPPSGQHAADGCRHARSLFGGDKIVERPPLREPRCEEPATRHPT